MKKKRLFGDKGNTQKEDSSKNSKKQSITSKQSEDIENEEKKEELIIYSKFIEKVISEINFARTKPSEYAAKLERISSTLKGRKEK